MDSFAGPWRFRPGDRGLKVYDSQIDSRIFKYWKSIAPDVIEAERTRYWAVSFLRKSDILARIAHIRFVQNRIKWMRQRLINAAPGHHIAAEKEPHD